MAGMPARLRALRAALSAWSWLPTLAFAVLPALIVRNKWTVVAGDATSLWGTYMFGDIRSWWKAACIVGIALWMLCTGILRFRFRQGGIVGILAAVAALGVLAATVLSPFPDTAWIGYTALYEGAFVLLAYLVAVWHAAGVEEARARLFVVRSVLLVIGVNVVLGILAGTGNNFWETDWGARVIGIQQDMIRHNFAGYNMASGTVYQPNHYGMLMAMLGALSLGMVFSEKKVSWKWVWAVAYAFCFAALLFSRSRAGMLVLLALTLAAVVFAVFRVQKKIPWFTVKKTLFVAAAVVAALGGLFVFIGFRDAAGQFLQRLTQLSAPLPVNSEIADVGLRENVISVISRDGGAVRVGKLSATTWYAESGGARRDLLRFAGKGDWRSVRLPGSSAATLAVNKSGNAVLTGEDARLEFFSPGTEIFAIDQTKTNIALRTEIPLSTHVPTGFDGILSARGYIWKRTAEKWLERPFFGWGPGTLALVFPNGELLRKQRYSFGEDEDKAHSVYLAFLVQTGVFGAILYLLPFGYAVFVLWRSRATLRLPLLLATAAYLACGLTNDSTPGVTPLFCVFAGLAAAEAGEEGREHVHPDLS